MKAKALLIGGALISIDQILKAVVPASLHPPHVPKVVIFTLVIAACLLLYRATISKLEARGISVIIAGGVSNFIDIFLTEGEIKDIFTLAQLDFNLADLYILSGALILLYGSVSRLNNKMSKLNT